MSILFHIAKSLLTNEIKDIINIKLSKEIEDCLGWKEFNIHINFDIQDVSELSYTDVEQGRNVWENIAKLSRDLWIDYEYYRHFSFKSQYDTDIYKSRLVNLGYICQEGVWTNKNKPNEADVQINLFSYCFYQFILDKMAANLINKENNVNEKLQLIIGQSRVGDGQRQSESDRNININILKCPNCEEENSINGVTCQICKTILSNNLDNCAIRADNVTLLVDNQRNSDRSYEEGYTSSNVVALNSSTISVAGTQAQYWSCTYCSSQNTLDSSLCEVCFTRMGNEPSNEATNASGDVTAVARTETNIRFDRPRFSSMRSTSIYSCTNRRCANNYTNDDHCPKCQLKKGSNLTEYNMVEVYDGNKYTNMWQCTFCGLFNESMKCKKCKNIRSNIQLKKCSCNWINKLNARTCKKCLKAFN